MRDRSPFLSVLLAIAVLGFSILACMGGGEPSIDEVVMARSLDDEYKPLEETTEFNPDETFYCSVEVSNLEKGAKVKANWFYGEEFLGEYTYTAEEGGSGYVGFHLTPEETWAIGDYTVEIYLDGELAKSIDFTVGGAEAIFDPIIFAQGVTDDNQPINPTSTFPAATTEVYAIFDYRGMVDGMKWEDKWYHEGEETAPGSHIWEGGESGSWWVNLYNEDGLASGNYELELYVEGQLLQSGTFTIEEAKGPSFGSVTFAAGATDAGEPVDVATQFPDGTTKVYAFTSYVGMSDGAQCESVWYLDGEEAMRTAFDWNLGESGTTWIANIHREGGLTPGRYDWELYVEGQLLQSATFVIGGEAATLTPDEIMSRSAEIMSSVSSAHIIFEQEVPGSYTRRGWGDVLLPDRAQFQESINGGEPVETIVIEATGYWRDDAAPGGWNLGPIAPFTSNPARWVPLSQYHASPIRLADETIDNTDCHHLQFTVNLPPGWLGLFSGGGTGEAWIAKADYSLVRAIYNLEYQGSREGGSMSLTLELSELNKPVSIVPPK